jgi:hypothetical protein
MHHLRYSCWYLLHLERQLGSNSKTKVLAFSKVNQGILYALHFLLYFYNLDNRIRRHRRARTSNTHSIASSIYYSCIGSDLCSYGQSITNQLKAVSMVWLFP